MDERRRFMATNAVVANLVCAHAVVRCDLSTTGTERVKKYVTYDEEPPQWIKPNSPNLPAKP